MRRIRTRCRSSPRSLGKAGGGRVFAVPAAARPKRSRRAIAPFLHNTDARIDDALERPGPTLEIWQLNAPDVRLPIRFAKLREPIATQARALPLARHAWARYRRRRYEQRIAALPRRKDRPRRPAADAAPSTKRRCGATCTASSATSATC